MTLKKQNSLIKQKKKSLIKRKYKELEGGRYYGKGTFGIAVGDPPIPVEGVKPDPSDNDYISKLLINESNLSDINQVIELLKNNVGPNYNDILKDYLVLPRFMGDKYIFNIDKNLYSSNFLTDDYWKDKKGAEHNQERELVRNATIQTQYLKANSGDLDDFKITSFPNYNSFLKKYEHILMGILLLHRYSIVHHDLKPANILVYGNGNDQMFKITDLDTMRNINLFTKENINDPDVSRLFYQSTWGYNYFPTAGVLLPTIFYYDSATDGTDFDYNTYLSKGLEEPFSTGCANYFIYKINIMIEKFTKFFPITGRENIQSLMRICKEKYGITDIKNPNLKIDGYFHDPRKLNELTEVYKELLKKLRAIKDEKKNVKVLINILVRYVDIYAFGMSLLEKTSDYMASINSPINSPVDKQIEDQLKSVMLFLSNILTGDYFYRGIYNFDIGNYYGITVLKKNINQPLSTQVVLRTEPPPKVEKQKTPPPVEKPKTLPPVEKQTTPQHLSSVSETSQSQKSKPKSPEIKNKVKSYTSPNISLVNIGNRIIKVPEKLVNIPNDFGFVKK